MKFDKKANNNLPVATLDWCICQGNCLGPCQGNCGLNCYGYCKGGCAGCVHQSYS